MNSGDSLQQIGKYEIRRRLGEGGMGAVYLGFDPLIEREVAIKVLASPPSEDDTSLKRFLAEARAVGKLNHPNAIAIYDIGQQDDRHYIVMELALGGSVSDLLEEQGKLTLQEACRITQEAAQGLAAAHHVGLIHRDVKPENLMLAADGTVKLVDFGLAKDVGRSSDLAITGAGQILGTPYYMSPEQINGDPVDARTDIYSLGATFYHLLTGSTPFPEQTLTKVLFAHVSAKRPDPRELDPSLPSACATLIAKALAVRPAQRYGSMDEFANELERILQESKVPAPRVSANQTIDVADTLPRVLIVEPSKLRAKVTIDAFQKAGCQNTICVSKSDEAIQQAESGDFNIAIASRELGAVRGEELLHSLSKASPEMMQILVSSAPPQQLIQEAPLVGGFACVSKQSNPDEALRLVHACTDNELLRLPFAAAKYEEVRIDIVTHDGALPNEFAHWIRELALLDVTPRSLADFESQSARVRDLLVWMLPANIPTEESERCRAIFLNDELLNHYTTAAIVDSQPGQMTLRALRRPAFVAACQRAFDCERLARVVDVAN